VSVRHELRLDPSRSLLADPRNGHNRLHPDIPPVLVVDPGDEVDLDLRDGFDGQITPASTADDVRRLDLMRGHPLTGPIAVRGAEPGDLLEVEVLDVTTASFGYTAIVPGVGAAAGRFTEPFLVRWEIADAVARSPDLPGVSVSGRPFLGFVAVAPSAVFVGVATRRERQAGAAGDLVVAPDSTSAVPRDGPPAEEGLPTLPPREIGGNLDVRHARAGSVVSIPVQVPGALCSVGDVHFAQGDGESCGLAIETSGRARLRLGLREACDGAWIPSMPMLRFEEETRSGPTVAALGISVDVAGRTSYLDPGTAARRAVSELIDYLVAERGLTAEQAYVLVGVAGNLQLSAIVNAPNALVAAVLPLDLFDEERR
jgi:formamidase